MKRDRVFSLAISSYNGRPIRSAPLFQLDTGDAAFLFLPVEDKSERGLLLERVAGSLSWVSLFTTTTVSYLRSGNAMKRKKPSPLSSSPSRYTKRTSYLLSFWPMRWMRLRSRPRGAGESDQKYVTHLIFFSFLLPSRIPRDAS
jgi:hypothetical protein